MKRISAKNLALRLSSSLRSSGLRISLGRGFNILAENSPPYSPAVSSTKAAVNEPSSTRKSEEPISRDSSVAVEFPESSISSIDTLQHAEFLERVTETKREKQTQEFWGKG